MQILLIITGGIAAYKSLDLIRRLRERGHGVRCVLTAGGAQFVTPLSVSALSGEKVYQDLWSLTDESEMGHIRLARDSDVIIVAPASANFIAKMAQGQGDDLASTIMLAADNPLLLAPAMNPVMWANAAVQQNIKTLCAMRPVTMVGPMAGDMACGEQGSGRMAEVVDILKALDSMTALRGRLQGLHALVTVGATREPIDPVRYITNHSSGRQGMAIATMLRDAGARVTVIAANLQVPVAGGMEIVSVQTADDMLQATHDALPADIAVFTAAVADYRAAQPAVQKIKKTGSPLSIELVENPDILASIAGLNGGQRPRLVVGFAAEDTNVIENASAKRVRKGCDWILANAIVQADGQSVFGSLQNQVSLITDKGIQHFPLQSKQAVAFQFVQTLCEFFEDT